MFLQAALSVYSKSKGFSGQMFLNDFEKLLEESHIELFHLFEKWCSNECSIRFDNELNKFELEILND